MMSLSTDIKRQMCRMRRYNYRQTEAHRPFLIYFFRHIEDQKYDLIIIQDKEVYK